MKLEVQPSDEHKQWCATKIREQFYWMQMIGLAHSAIGIQLTSPVAEPIFSQAVQHILTITRGTLNLASNGRDHERFVFFLDWCITQRFVNCIMASGVGPQDVPAGTPLSPAIIADVIATSCELNGTAIECIQAIAMVIAARPHPLPTPDSPLYQAIPAIASLLDNPRLTIGDTYIVFIHIGKETEASMILSGLRKAGVATANIIGPQHTVYSVSKAALAGAIVLPALNSNIFDISMADLFRFKTPLTVQAIFAHVTTPTESIQMAQIARLYSSLIPNHIQIDAAALTILQHASTDPGFSITAVHEPMVVGLHNYAPKFDRPPPAVKPIIDRLCITYGISQSFFIQTTENIQSTHVNALPGLFHYIPVNVTPVDVPVTTTTVNGATHTFMIPYDQWQHELMGGMRGIGGAMIRANRKIPSVGMPNRAQIKSLLELQRMCDHLPPYVQPSAFPDGAPRPVNTSVDLVMQLVNRVPIPDDDTFFF